MTTDFRNPKILFVIGIANILFFGVYAFIVVRKLLENRPWLIIDSIGLTHNLGGVFTGLIFWNDIENISVIEENGQKFIILAVKNPQKYID